jgi:hypothetical protein
VLKDDESIVDVALETVAVDGLVESVEPIVVFCFVSNDDDDNVEVVIVVDNVDVVVLSLFDVTGVAIDTVDVN